MQRLQTLGYELGSREDAGMVSWSETTIGDYRIKLEHSSYAPETGTSRSRASLSGENRRRLPNASRA